MKKILFCMFLLIQISLYGQNIIDPGALSFQYNGSSANLSPTLFPQNNFIIGWQWGDNPRVSYEISSNMYQPSTPHNIQNFP